ncbi:hypothetical protein V5E97_06300 [Singulisphaera sp. Ch08]|uniref:Uncharacterized protein n=1 Tax=Singulisphaera sp. Ch08 TaxID=3120278 RepID=A0AAU7CJQ0_9BACT
MNRPRFRFTLSALVGFVLVAGLALSPISAGLHTNTLIKSYYQAAVGILAVAALRMRVSERAFWLGFAASGSVFLLVSGWLRTPPAFGWPAYGLVFEATWAMALGILGGLLMRRYANPVG